MQYQLPLKRQQSLALWRVSDSLLQRADYLYAYNHRRFTTTDNGNEHTTRPLSSGNSTSVVSVEPRVGVGAIRAVVKAAVGPHLKRTACVCQTRAAAFSDLPFG